MCPDPVGTHHIGFITRRSLISGGLLTLMWLISASKEQGSHLAKPRPKDAIDDED